MEPAPVVAVTLTVMSALSVAPPCRVFHRSRIRLQIDSLFFPVFVTEIVPSANRSRFSSSRCTMSVEASWEVYMLTAYGDLRDMAGRP